MIRSHQGLLKYARALLAADSVEIRVISCDPARFAVVLDLFAWVLLMSRGKARVLRFALPAITKA
jgi:hypothetical protein